MKKKLKIICRPIGIGNFEDTAKLWYVSMPNEVTIKAVERRLQITRRILHVLLKSKNVSGGSTQKENAKVRCFSLQ